jgi:cytochrome c oxidase assembly protein subunit 11
MKNRTALYSALFAAFMFAVAFAAVPLYDMFCRATGFGGAAIVTKDRPTRVSSREFTLTLESTVAPGLTWSFAPESRFVKMKAGEVVTINYYAENKGSESITGIASYNVDPPQVGRYFNKLQCFCFTEQTILPGQRLEMPVVVFIDPEIDNDREFKRLNGLTLQYTFFPVKSGAKKVSELSK